MGKDTLMLILFGVLILGIGIFYLIDKSKNGKPKASKASYTPQEPTKVQGVKKPAKAVEQKDMSGFIKFDKIANDMIYQNNGERYTMVIQCKGINYNLMSEIEQMAVEEGFIMFLNTLKFPIQLYVQTRSIDLADSVKLYKERAKEFADKQMEVTARYNELEDDVDSTQEEIDYMKKEKIKYTNIAEYTADITRYVEKMALNKYMLQRNFYIILSYNKSELVTTEKFTKEEYEDLCYRELYTRARGIIGALMSCSVEGRVLNSNELAQLIYISFNKDDANVMNIKDALESGIFRLYTSSEDVMKRKRDAIEEELNRQSEIRVDEAIRKAIEKGLLVTQAESEEEIRKEVDRRALKIIDRAPGDEKTKQVLKNTIKEDRRERLQAIEEQKRPLELEQQTEQEQQESILTDDIAIKSEDENIISEQKEGGNTDVEEEK